MLWVSHCLAYAAVHSNTETAEENEYEVMMLNKRDRETKTATSMTGVGGGWRQGELTQSILTRELRPRTVSKSSRGLQGDYGPPVRHNYWNTASLFRIETLRGASTDWRAGGSRKHDSPALSYCINSANTEHKQSCLTIAGDNSAQRSDGRYLYKTLMSNYPHMVVQKSYFGSFPASGQCEKKVLYLICGWAKTVRNRNCVKITLQDIVFVNIMMSLWWFSQPCRSRTPCDAGNNRLNSSPQASNQWT